MSPRVGDGPTFEVLPPTPGEPEAAGVAGLVRFCDVQVMIQRSVIDGKILVTVITEEASAADQDVRIDVNDGTIYDQSCDEPQRLPKDDRPVGTEFGNLYASDTADSWQIIPFGTYEEAIEAGKAVGEPRAIMDRVDGGEWRSLFGGLTVAQVFEREWHS